MIESGQYWALKKEDYDTSWPRFIMILHQWPTNKDMFCCLSLSGFNGLHTSEFVTNHYEQVK